MADSTTTTGTHPLVACVAVVRAALAEVADAPAWSLNPTETTRLVVQVAGLQAQLAELEARILHHAETTDVAAEAGHRSTPAWLAHHTRHTMVEAHKRVRLAATLDAHQPTRDALARGEVRPEQARVILDAVDDLPTHHAAAADDRDRAEKHLLAEAEHHDAKALRILGGRIVELIDPAGADAHEAKMLERHEALAAQRCRLTLTDVGDGTSHGRFILPTVQAAMLRKMLAAFAAPHHQRAVHGAGTYQWDKPTPQRLGQALCELIERYPRDRLPQVGGVNAAVVVTIPYATLQGELVAAGLDTGEKISPGQALRLLCGAGVMPAVLDGRGHVLHLGRKRRFHTEAQRLALGLTQQHCQHEGCQTAAAFCHTHHTWPWETGGPTDLTHAQLLCPYHHRQAHLPRRC